VGVGVGVTAGRIVSMAVWTVVVARRIGPDTYGFYAFAQAVVSVLVIFVSLGMDEVTTRDVARRPGRGRSYLGTVARVKVALSALVLGGFVAVSLAGDPGRGEIAIVVLVSAMGAVQALNALTMALLQAHEAMHLFVAGQATNYVFTMVSGVVAIALDRTFAIVLVFSLVASLLQLGLTLAFVRRKLAPRAGEDDAFPRLADVPALARTALPFATVTIITVVHANMLIILLKAGSYSDTSLGHFAAAQRLATLVLVVPSVVSQVLIPAFSRTYAHDPAQFKGMFERAYRYGLFFSVPAASATLRVLVLVVAGATGYVLAPALVAMDRQGLVARLQSLNLVITGVLAFALIGRMGAEGAAWALVVGAAWTLVAYSRILYKSLDLPYPGAWVTKTAIASAVTAAACLAANEAVHFLVVLVLVAPVTYALAHALLRTLDADEWRYVRSVVAPAPKP
jgi:O-antigen/teichoic acid export membrane protein